MLWRDMRDRYGDYFEGGMGAEAIKRAASTHRPRRGEIKLRDAIDPAEGSASRASASEGHQAPEGHRVQPRDRTHVNDPKAMILDASR
jgi:DNA-directed RNA polymerase subunit beta'